VFGPARPGGTPALPGRRRKDGECTVFGVNGWEVVLLALIAVFVLGPDRMPEYAAKLAQAIRKLRIMAEGARGQLKDQLGPEYEDINWRQYDPRQYDPRRIVKEALLDPLDDAIAPVRDEIGSVRDAARLKGGAAGAAGAMAGAGAAALGAGPSDGDGMDPVDAGNDAPYVSRLPGPTEWDPSRPTPYDVDAT
jgi:sec-independent protein translocase protein TatB